MNSAVSSTTEDPVVLQFGPRRPVAVATKRAHCLVDGNLALTPEPVGIDVQEAAGQVPAQASRSAVIVARALLEVLSGWRPASQLSRWTSFALQQDLERRLHRRPSGSRQQLLKVRVTQQRPGLAEVCALAHDAARDRIRVIAFRMEDREGEWIVTRLQAG